MSFYHVRCPIAGKRFYRPNMTSMRRFVYAIFSRRPYYAHRIGIYRSDDYVGAMWIENGTVFYQQKGSSVPVRVRKNGSLME